MATVASAIDRCRQTVNMGNDIALKYLQEALDEMAVYLPVNMTVEDLPAVANQREYTLSVLAKRIWMVEWVTGATDSERRRLTPTNVSSMNSNQGNWRRVSSGTPSKRYAWLNGDSRVVGVLPAPSDSASGGYPLIRVHQSRTMTLTSGGNLPSGLLGLEAICLMACAKYAVVSGLDKRIATLQAGAEKAMQKEIEANAAVGFYDVEDPPSFAPNWLVVGGVGF